MIALMMNERINEHKISEAQRDDMTRNEEKGKERKGKEEKGSDASIKRRWFVLGLINFRAVGPSLTKVEPLEVGIFLSPFLTGDLLYVFNSAVCHSSSAW